MYSNALFVEECVNMPNVISKRTEKKEIQYRRLKSAARSNESYAMNAPLYVSVVHFRTSYSPVCQPLCGDTISPVSYLFSLEEVEASVRPEDEPPPRPPPLQGRRLVLRVERVGDEVGGVAELPEVARVDDAQRVVQPVERAPDRGRVQLADLLLLSVVHARKPQLEDVATCKK